MTKEKSNNEIDEFYKQGVMESAFYNELIKKINAMAGKKKYEELSLENKRKMLREAVDVLVKHHLYLR